MRSTAFGEDFGKRVGIGNVSTLAAAFPGKRPVTFIRHSSDADRPGTTTAAPAESAFSIQVLMRGLVAPKLSFGRAPAEIYRAEAGSVFLFDLEKPPVATFNSPLDNVRFYISRETLRELAAENGLRYGGGLKAPAWGSPDATFANLAGSLIPRFERPHEAATLFVDHVALAFFTHLVTAYGETPTSVGKARGGLAPWQTRRVNDLIEARLSEDVSLSELAAACGLSSSYFSRAFKSSYGRAPYQFLLERRIDMAKGMILRTSMPLSYVAEACGFSDQSHLARVFSRIVGRAPSVWKRDNI
ncbi:AraC family transcriptional regulator [Beijerinckia sp. L45]|uniref:helix-turn-helix domain-containing protein n=1 Tax=Beijerinckia sp. L45 TaxID=1641855 RepID=UPI00131AC4E5|nr:AraC family transcriptional regulator [Beijerinckia sp. L45]